MSVSSPVPVPVAVPVSVIVSVSVSVSVTVSVNESVPRPPVNVSVEVSVTVSVAVSVIVPVSVAVSVWVSMSVLVAVTFVGGVGNEGIVNEDVGTVVVGDVGKGRLPVVGGTVVDEEDSVDVELVVKVVEVVVAEEELVEVASAVTVDDDVSETDVAVVTVVSELVVLVFDDVGSVEVDSLVVSDAVTVAVLVGSRDRSDCGVVLDVSKIDVEVAVPGVDDALDVEAEVAGATGRVVRSDSNRAH